MRNRRRRQAGTRRMPSGKPPFAVSIAPGITRDPTPPGLVSCHDSLRPAQCGNATVITVATSQRAGWQHKERRRSLNRKVLQPGVFHGEMAVYPAKL
jgi:hypothetical protein